MEECTNIKSNSSTKDIFIEDTLFIESFNLKYIKTSNKKIFIVLNDEIIQVKEIDIYMTLGILREKLNLDINYIFTYDRRDIKYKLESDIIIKDILLNNELIILKEEEININIYIDNIKEVYKIKYSKNKTLSKLRSDLDIKNIYKFVINNKYILLFQENKYNINDIIKNKADIHLKMVTDLDNNFSKSEINFIESEYYFKFNKSIYKMKLNNDDNLFNIRNIFQKLYKLDNYDFVNIKGERIEKNKEKKIKIKSISLLENGKNYINIKKLKKPIESSIFLQIKNNLKIYKYPKISLNKNQIQKCKILIVIGETGNGKTTLLNCLINYLMDIKKDDDFRYIIIDENNINNEYCSHTSDINSYYILPSNKDIPPIRLIDTPGFGDTRENFDFEILKKFTKFFEKEKRIDLICFVIKSNVNRFTELQKYIMSNIFGIFGKDLISKFLFLLTFYDGGDPLIVNSLTSNSNPFNKIINKISKPFYILFNNSSIFSDDENYKNLFWDISYEGFSQLILKLKTIFGGSLYLTNEIIKSRNDILFKCENLNKVLDNCLNIRNILDNNIKKLKQEKIELENHKDFIIKIKQEKIEKIDTECGIHNINCIKCNKTCHSKCGEIKNGDILSCVKFKDKYCEICGCSFNEHDDLPYYFSIIIKEENKINIKNYNYFEKTHINISEIDSLNEIKINELKENIISANAQICEIKKIFNILDKLSLFSNIYEIQENFSEYKIITEKTLKNYGYLEKVEIYQRYKNIFSILNNIYQKNDILKNINEFYNDFNTDRDAILDKIKYILFDGIKNINNIHN